jgi:hypothetical protein
MRQSPIVPLDAREWSLSCHAVQEKDKVEREDANENANKHREGRDRAARPLSEPLDLPRGTLNGIVEITVMPNLRFQYHIKYCTE